MTQNNEIVAVTEDAAIAAIGKHFPKGSTRNPFPSIAEAVTALEAVMADDAIPELPYSIVGQNEDGEVDSAIYDGCHAVLAQVRARVDMPAGGKKEGIKAFVIFPIPTLESIVGGGEQGTEFLNKIVEKELAHVAFRNFREASTVDEFLAGVSAAPRNLADYLTSQVYTVDTDTFDTIWPDFREALKTSYKDLWALLAQLGKGNILRAIRSKSYAEANPDAVALEQAGIFVMIASEIIKIAEANEMDASAIAGWIANRDTTELSYKAPEKVTDTSFLSGFSFAQ